MKHLLAFFLCLISYSQLALAEEFSARVDRADLNSGESFELTLEVLDRNSANLPDLSVLDADFKVLSSKQNNFVTEQNGNKQQNTRWRLILLPSKQGNLVIPRIFFGQLASDPIFISVKNIDAPKNMHLAPVFIDSQLDQDQVYVNAQLILTLRIYHAYALQADTQLSPLLMPQARIEPLGQPRLFDQFINGERFGVIQMRYAIFPQQAGKLKIPAQSFSATLLKAASAFDQQAAEKVRVQSSEIPFTVKPIPAAYPTDAPWLPAKNLSLSQQLQPDEGPYYTDNAINYQLYIAAEGLPSSELPKLLKQLDVNAKVFSEQPILQEQEGALGLVSSRHDSIALLPYQAGILDIPRQSITWWNTQSDSLEHTELAPIKLNIVPTISSEPTLPAPSIVVESDNYLWQLLAGLLGLACVLFIALWLHARRQPAIVSTPKADNSQQLLLLTQLKQACQQGQPKAARTALDAWARLQPDNLVQMTHYDADLALAIEQLNSVLYSDNSQTWQGQALWQAVETLSSTNRKANSSLDESLPPLYPE